MCNGSQSISFVSVRRLLLLGQPKLLGRTLSQCSNDHVVNNEIINKTRNENSLQLLEKLEKDHEADISLTWNKHPPHMDCLVLSIIFGRDYDIAAIIMWFTMKLSTRPGMMTYLQYSLQSLDHEATMSLTWNKHLPPSHWLIYQCLVDLSML